AILVFFGVVIGVWSVLTVISERNRKSLDRLARHSRPASLAEIEDPKGPRKGERFQGITEVAKAMSNPMMPQTELEQSALRVRLANAGFRGESAPAVYSGLRVAALVLSFLLSLPMALP